MTTLPASAASAPTGNGSWFAAISASLLAVAWGAYFVFACYEFIRDAAS